MAKKQTQEPEVVENGMATVQETTQAISTRQSFIEKGDVTGTEDIKGDDLRMPRLTIAQGMTPQLTEGSIEGLKIGEMFNDLSSRVYGKGPLSFIVLRRDVRRIEFKPREEGGGVVDLDVPYLLPNGEVDPRNKWTFDEEGNKVPPAATKYTEFVSMLLLDDGSMEPVVISIKDTNKHNRRAIERLNGFIKFLRKPIYAGIYSIATRMEKKDTQVYYVPVVNQNGTLDNPNVDDEQWARQAALYQEMKKLAAELEGKVITINREPGDDESFDTEAMDAEASGDRPQM